MDVMRQLERKLEAVLERSVGQMFGGTPHVSELAGSLVRVLDLSVDSHGLVPNRIMVPGSLPAESLPGLESAIAEAIAERGWRIEGPVTVVPAQVRSVTVTIERGPLAAWATLEGPGRPVLRVNRAVIGRSSDCDVVLEDPSISRRHARLWHQDDRVLGVDLGSSNGTLVDGQPVGGSPVEIGDGSVVTFGAVPYVFRRSARA